MHCWYWSCFGLLIVNRWCILVCVCTWIFNGYLNWYFVFRSVWVSYGYCCVFFTCSCGIDRCLVLKLSTTWKVGNITNWTFGIWCFTNINRLIFSYRSIYISLSWICGYSNLNWDFILRSVWISDYDCCVFFTFCCCIDRCFELEGCTTWKFWNIADWVLGIWCITNFNRLIFRSWIVLICIRTWIFNCYLNWDFIFWTVWVSDDNSRGFFTCSCGIYWCLVLKCSTFWKVADVTDWILSVWLVAWFNRLILSYWSVLIRIGAWIFNCYFNWNFILRTIWVSDNNCCVFLTFCCCINRCLVLKCSTTW